jgi:branched-subunit amino acid aminotransferase/4-amino-4-deoxychorismate lyase
MQEPVAYVNGQYVPVSAATIPVTDGGFVQGVTVAEQLRTFGGQLFRLQRHLERLAHSLEIVGIHPSISLTEIGRVAQELAQRNHSLLDPADDLGLSVFVTPGPYATFETTAARAGPTVGMHTYPLPFHLWFDKYELGQSLVITSVMQVPAACWPPDLKCRSRMHYYLADRQARQIEPGARALLLDESGQVVEASTANVVAYFRGEGIVSPPREAILPGVSLAVLEELAGKLGQRFLHRRLEVEELARADEVLLCSTSPCVWPVTRLAGKPIADGRPGPLARQLLAAWSEMVGLDISAQARRFARRSGIGAALQE